jgi:hypothetical protein
MTTNFIAVTGPRYLDERETTLCKLELEQILDLPDTHLHVGDAGGLDALAYSIASAPHRATTITQYLVNGSARYDFSNRSMRMVDGLCSSGGCIARLHGFPNKPCPLNISLKSWQGSGTWGTIFYANSRGIHIVLHRLNSDIPIPGWLESQLTLL